MNTLTSHLSRQDRELRDLRGQQERQEQRDEPPEAGPSKVSVCSEEFNRVACEKS